MPEACATPSACATVARSLRSGRRSAVAVVVVVVFWVRAVSVVLGPISMVTVTLFWVRVWIPSWKRTGCLRWCFQWSGVMVVSGVPVRLVMMGMVGGWWVSFLAVLWNF